MSDVTRRLSRWKAKYSPEIAAQTTARIYADMTERHQAAMITLCTMETETKQVLSASGIDTVSLRGQQRWRDSRPRYTQTCRHAGRKSHASPASLFSRAPGLDFCTGATKLGMS